MKIGCENERDVKGIQEKGEKGIKILSRFSD
jgi:hypothetical protein